MQLFFRFCSAIDISLVMTAVWLNPAIEDNIFSHIKFIIKNSSIQLILNSKKRKYQDKCTFETIVQIFSQTNNDIIIYSMPLSLLFFPSCLFFTIQSNSILLMLYWQYRGDFHLSRWVVALQSANQGRNVTWLQCERQVKAKVLTD